MSTPGPSLPYLLRHELRIAWRTLTPKRAGAAGRRRFALPGWAVALAAVVAVAVLAGIPAGRALADVDIALTPLAVVVADFALLAVLPLMLSSTLVVAVQALYERGDLDLLLSSPVSPTKVLTVRAFGMAINVALVFYALLTPFLLPIAVLGHPEFLALYIVGAALALFAAAVGLAIAMALFRILGARRTKTVAQVAAAMIGASFAIVANIPNFMGEDESASFWTRVAQRFLTGDIHVPKIAEWPARAVFGEPLPLLAMVAIGIAAFALASTFIGRRFAENAAAAKGAGRGAARVARGRARAFRGGAFGSMVRKELRLIRRDPGLLSHVLLRVFYFIPLAFVTVRSAAEAPEVTLALSAGGLVFLTNQLAGAVSWITISAEDSPQLLASSPVPARLIWRAKLAAAAVPLVLVVTGPLVALIAVRPPAGMLCAVGCLVAAATSGLINIWQQKPGRREQFRKKYGPTVAATVIDIASGAAWAAMTGFAVYGNWLNAAIAFAIGAALVGSARRGEQAILDRVISAV